VAATPGAAAFDRGAVRFAAGAFVEAIRFFAAAGFLATALAGAVLVRDRVGLAACFRFAGTRETLVEDFVFAMRAR
jgi:hypothetical protein